MIGAVFFLAALHQAPDSVSPTVRDILAGYHAWETSCEASACSTQASDQVTTITLKRTAKGLEMSLAPLRCADRSTLGRAFIPAKLLRPGDRRQNAERVLRVAGAFISIDNRALKSCGLDYDRAGPHVYDLLLLDRFLKQSDAVAGTRGKAR